MYEHEKDEIIQRKVEFKQGKRFYKSKAYKQVNKRSRKVNDSQIKF